MGLRVWSGGEIFGKKNKNTLGGHIRPPPIKSKVKQTFNLCNGCNNIVPERELFQVKTWQNFETILLCSFNPTKIVRRPNTLNP